MSEQVKSERFGNTLQIDINHYGFGIVILNGVEVNTKRMVITTDPGNALTEVTITLPLDRVSGTVKVAEVCTSDSEFKRKERLL
jgi:hypothetical protein